MSISARRLIVTLTTPLIAGMLSWLVEHGPSPPNYLLANIVGILNLPAFVIAALLSGNVHAPDYWALAAGTFAEWLPFGYVVSLLAIRPKVRA